MGFNSGFKGLKCNKVRELDYITDPILCFSVIMLLSPPSSNNPDCEDESVNRMHFNRACQEALYSLSESHFLAVAISAYASSYLQLCTNILYKYH